MFYFEILLLNGPYLVESSCGKAAYGSGVRLLGRPGKEVVWWVWRKQAAPHQTPQSWPGWARTDLTEAEVPGGEKTASNRIFAFYETWAKILILESHMFPFVQVWQVDLAVGVDVFAGLDHHRTGGLHKAYRRIVGIRIQQPQAHGNIVHIPWNRTNMHGYAFFICNTINSSLTHLYN